VSPLHVRPAVPADVDALARQMATLWPAGSVDAHRAEAVEIIAGRPPTTLPLVLLVAEREGRVIGFVEVGLRSHADGCDPRIPVGYLEGWYVEPDHRRTGAGRALVEAAETWVRAQGCRELASDTWLEAELSQHAHAALGFEVVDRVVHYRKPLG
jgi:aminoglycoside 6'-N-acetyltransferase I